MISWGILGAGNIASRFARSLSHEADACLTAVSCRTQQKADLFARQYGVPCAYDNYEKMLENRSVDAVYLALPHGLHREWAVRALNAGKAVLCEKPAALNAEEVQEITATAQQNGVLFMEAMKGRFVPLYARIKSVVEEGIIGEIVSIETSLCNLMPPEMLNGKTYHTQPGQGGVLLDSGIYCANWLEEYTKGSLRRIRTAAELKDGLDHYVDAELECGGVQCRLECAFDRTKPRNAVLHGTRGKIVIQELHRPVRAELYRDEAEMQTLEEPYENDDFYGQIHHFHECLIHGRTESGIMPFSASVRCAEILDLIRSGMEQEQI